MYSYLLIFCGVVAMALGASGVVIAARTERQRLLAGNPYATNSLFGYAVNCVAAGVLMLAMGLGVRAFGL